MDISLIDGESLLWIAAAAVVAQSAITVLIAAIAVFSLQGFIRSELAHHREHGQRSTSRRTRGR